jgi:predicted regulator of Ras-like GTPase activity (Roadblock/LC7/MglB family)
MEAILKEINSVVGVTGSFVCSDDGNVTAQALPASFSADSIALAARVATQTFHALEISGRHIPEADLTFEQGSLILKNLRGAILVIVCARNINLPFLNLTANVAAKKIADELKAPVAAPVSTPAPEPITPPVAPRVPEPEIVAPPAAPRAPDSGLAELEGAWQQIAGEAEKSKTILRVMNSLAVWLSCPNARGLLLPPDKKQLVFAARSAQRESIRRALERVGYQTNQSPDEFFASPRLYFTNFSRGTFAEIHLDKFAMYHQFDLAPFLAQEGATLAETALVLARLQLVEMPEAGLRELSALLLDHDTSPRDAPGKIALSALARLCADEWGWYKTVTMNLQRVMAFAVKTLAPDDKVIVVERAERIYQAVERTPKSLGWQARARIGENMRWYDLPSAAGPEQRAVEIRYGD